MNRKILFLLTVLFVGCAFVSAQDTQKSNLQQRAEEEFEKGQYTNARALYKLAYENYVNKGQIKLGVECGTKAAALYYRENFYPEAFDLLRRLDQNIDANSQSLGSAAEALHYLTSKERMQIYMKIRRGASVVEQLNIMEKQASVANDEALNNDLLYNKAIYYYTFGQNAQGNAVFKEMADKLTASKEYDKVDEVYQTLIANGRKSGSTNLVAQAYRSYIVWKDSVNALKVADEIGALKSQITDDAAAIEEKDSLLTARQAMIVGLSILAVILAAVLVFGTFLLLRYIHLTRKQKKAINMANENNALKAKFISNISAQLNPTLLKLNGDIPEVKALREFSEHIQTLSELENAEQEVELEDIQISQFCESLMDQVRDKAKNSITLEVSAPKMSVKLNKAYVSHILLHLLSNALEYTPDGGKVSLEFKKRSAHKVQFLVSDTGCGIPEEKHEDVFKAFLEIKDLSEGDGLGLPICKQMALNMNGDLEISSAYTKGARFVLSLNI
ncbi:MAG: sensor histidine kinase [Prevotella sp.]|nr:sensor histidine kinase [Prevotella sp.]